LLRRIDDGDLFVAFRETLRRSSAANADGTGNAIAVTSASPREGKTRVALRLALQAAEIFRERTLIVDAAAQQHGCATRILQRRRQKAADEREPLDARCTATDLALLDLLTWGPRLIAPPTNGGSASASLADVLLELRAKYDLIVLDASSMSDGPNVLALLRCADRVLFVVEHRRRSAGQIRSHIDRIDAPEILGAVLNKRRYPIPRFIYERL
jgi:Mrp family chromosome partitioning ATPase